MSVSIREAGTGDIDAVLAVWAEARSAAARTADDPEALEALLERDPGALLVAEADGAVVGVLIAGWDGWRGNVYRLAVLPSHRRQAIARTLVEAGHERLRALGARRTVSGGPSATSGTSSSTASCAIFEHVRAKCQVTSVTTAQSLTRFSPAKARNRFREGEIWG